MSDLDRRPSVDFEPVVIRPSRRRRPDPVLLGVVVVVLGLAAAVLKPWDSGPTGVIASPPASPAPRTIALPSASPRDAAAPADADAVPAALQPHDAWGLRIVAGATHDPRGASGPFAEHWQAATPTTGSTDAASAPPLVEISAPGIVAVGVTSPAGSTPLDIRGWARGDDGRWHRLELGTYPSGRPDAELLLPPPTVDGVALPTWPSGQYRFDLLLGQSVGRMDLIIDPDGPPSAPPVSGWSSIATGDAAAWLGNVPVGAYAVVSGVVRPIPGSGGGDLTDAQAWLGGDRVAGDWQPAATALGVLLPPGATDARGFIRRVAPDPFPVAPKGQVDIRFDPSGEPVPWVQFEAPAGDRFEPGVYAMELAWRGRDGAQTSSWTVDLWPGPAPRATTMLAAARRFAVAAGRDGLILSGAGRRQPDWMAAPVRSFALAPSIGCAGAAIDETPAVLGLGHAPNVVPGTVSARIARPNGQDEAVPLRVSRAVIPGLTLIAPAGAEAFAAGTYRFRVTGDPATDGFTLCLGAAPPGG